MLFAQQRYKSTFLTTEKLVYNDHSVITNKGYNVQILGQIGHFSIQNIPGYIEPR
jgi:hypothetical protein